MEKVAADAKLIRSGALDDQISGLCDAYEKYNAAKNDVARFDREIDHMDTQVQEYIQKKQFMLELKQRYEDSNFAINLRAHEKINEKQNTWGIMCCPRQDCQGFVDFNGSEGTCCACGTVLCEKCHADVPGGGHQCVKEDIESVAKMISDSKPCPGCLSPIFRVSGCTHMHCSACRHDFDWVTMKPLRKHETTNPMGREQIRTELTVTDLIKPVFGRLKCDMKGDVDAIAILSHIEQCGWINIVLDQTQWFSVLLDKLKVTTNSQQHPLFSYLQSGSVDDDHTLYAMLILMTCFCTSVVNMTYTIRTSTRREDIERYKYLSGIKDQRAYQESLYNQKKKLLIIENRHIPACSHKIKEIVAMMRPMLTALRADDRTIMKETIRDVSNDFEQWWIDAADEMREYLDIERQEEVFRKMLPKDKVIRDKI